MSAAVAWRGIGSVTGDSPRLSKLTAKRSPSTRRAISWMRPPYLCSIHSTAKALGAETLRRDSDSAQARVGASHVT
jgi:hypothetical protein